jgi:hypothetical protein
MAKQTQKTAPASINSSWADIDREADELAPGPFVQALPGGESITFPDPLEMDWQEIDEFISDVLNSPTSEQFKKWLSAEDYDKLDSAGLQVKHILVISKKVAAHYGQIADLLGEANASRR